MSDRLDQLLERGNFSKERQSQLQTDVGKAQEVSETPTVPTPVINQDVNATPTTPFNEESITENSTVSPALPDDAKKDAVEAAYVIQGKKKEGLEARYDNSQDSKPEPTDPDKDKNRDDKEPER